MTEYFVSLNFEVADLTSGRTEQNKIDEKNEKKMKNS